MSRAFYFPGGFLPLRRAVVGGLVGLGVFFLLGHATRVRLAADRACEARQATPASRSGRTAAAPCHFPYRNPAVLSDGRLRFRAVVRSQPQPIRTRLRTFWQKWIDRQLNPWPGIHSLAGAVWLGNSRELPGGLPEQYTRGGIIHLLVLSGQHVFCLVLLLRSGWGLAAPAANRSRWGRRVFGGVWRLLPVLAAGLLFGLNPGNEPTARAAAIIVASSLLGARAVYVPPWQRVLSCVAVLVLVAPTRVASDGFILSAVATLWLSLLSLGESLQTRWGKTLLAASAMPLLLLPVTAFLFSKVSLMGVVNGVCFGWVWSAVWIPLGFLAPILPWGLGPETLAFVESVWLGFVRFQQWLEPWMGLGYWTVPRPTWAECLALQCVLGWGVFKGLNWACRGLMK